MEGVTCKLRIVTRHDGVHGARQHARHEPAHRERAWRGKAVDGTNVLLLVAVEAQGVGNAVDALPGGVARLVGHGHHVGICAVHNHVACAAGERGYGRAVEAHGAAAVRASLKRSKGAAEAVACEEDNAGAAYGGLCILSNGARLPNKVCAVAVHAEHVQVVDPVDEARGAHVREHARRGRVHAHAIPEPAMLECADGKDKSAHLDAALRVGGQVLWPVSEVAVVVRLFGEPCELEEGVCGVVALASHAAAAAGVVCAGAVCVFEVGQLPLHAVEVKVVWECVVPEVAVEINSARTALIDLVGDDGDGRAVLVRVLADYKGHSHCSDSNNKHNAQKHPLPGCARLRLGLLFRAASLQIHQRDAVLISLTRHY